MAISSTTAAVIGAVIGVAGAVQSSEAQSQANRQAKKSQKAQEQAGYEQKALQAQQAAQEKRAQIREERVKRAKVLQASENTGVAGSSGEAGAIGSLSTNLASNLGFNKGQIDGAGRISALNQQASDFMSASQNKINEANTWGAVQGLGTSIFSAAGGFNTLFPSSTTPATPSTLQPANVSRGGGFSTSQ